MTMGQGEKGVEVAELITRRRLLRERDAERRRQHAHDGERGPADLHSLSNDGRQPAEATLEQAVRQHDARWSSSAGNRASEDRAPVISQKSPPMKAMRS